MGRFINADALVATGQGILGNNMFAYCRSNPVCRRDVSGATDEKCYEGASDPLGDDEELTGGKMGRNGPDGNGNSQSVGRTSPGGNSGPSNTPPNKVEGNNYAGNSGRTEVHHVVEQCQSGKSGFNKEQIRE